MIVTSASVSPHVGAAVARHGVEPHSIIPISPLGARKGRRAAYRVESADGRIVKAREFETEDAARRVFELRARCEDAFAPALARYGAVLIEEWIEGVPLVSLDWEARLHDAGALLGRLHKTTVTGGEPATVSTGRWVDAAGSDLEILVSAGAILRDEAAQFRARIVRHDPRIARTSLVHMDFCGDNMVVGQDGRLWVIDNEQLEIGPSDLDLGRTFHLWPMTDEAWSRFEGGYRSSAPAAPAAAHFWQLIATLLGARVFLTRSEERLEYSLRLLRRLCEGDDSLDPGPS